jgi:hypothetical protein
MNIDTASIVVAYWLVVAIKLLCVIAGVKIVDMVITVIKHWRR